MADQNKKHAGRASALKQLNEVLLAGRASTQFGTATFPSK
jgi:hypothetical protein